MILSKYHITTLIYILVTCHVYAQNNCNVYVGPLPDKYNAAQSLTGTSEPLDIAFTLTEFDTSLKLSINAATGEPKEENYIAELKQFKDTAQLIYLDDKNKFLTEPRHPAPPLFYKRVAMDANKGDNSAPLDNSIAISDNGNLLSVSNGLVEYYKDYRMKFSRSLSSFFGNKPVNSVFDPRVVYDPVNDRFIVVALYYGVEDGISEVLVAFSVSDKPEEGFNFYSLPGNMLGRRHLWFDYPNIAISQAGLFITGNIYEGRNFIESVIYQLEYKSGYSGDKMRHKVWYNIYDKPFALQPVANTYTELCDNGMFFLSSLRYSNSNSVQLYHITGDIINTASTINHYRVSTQPYYFFAEADQHNQKIDNGDMRVCGALLSRNKIYYVFTSGNERNFSRVNLHVLDLANLADRSVLIGDKPNYSYAYPSIHMLSEENEEDKIFVQYNSSSDNSFPSIRCKICDANLLCSEERLLRKGDYTIEAAADEGEVARWGDYSAITKNHGKRNSLWLTSSYGNSDGKRSTFLTNVTLTPVIRTITGETGLHSEGIRFVVPENESVKVFLRSKTSFMKILEEDVQKGENTLNLDVASLETGEYSIEVVNDKMETISHKEIELR